MIIMEKREHYTISFWAGIAGLFSIIASMASFAAKFRLVP